MDETRKKMEKEGAKGCIEKKSFFRVFSDCEHNQAGGEGGSLGHVYVNTRVWFRKSPPYLKESRTSLA